MKIRQIAVLLIRVTGIDWLFNTAALMTYLPPDLSRAQVSLNTYGFASPSSATSLKWLLINLSLHVALSLGLLVYAHPIAAFITRDLENASEQPDPSSA